MFVRRRHAAGVLLSAALTLSSQAGLRAQPAAAQAPAPTSAEALAAEIATLQQAIETLQTQLADARTHTVTLEQSMQELRDRLEEEQALLTAQAGTLEQTKVESGSKYRARLFGMALMQLTSTRGAVDNIDLPTLAVETDPGDSGGNVSASVRQSYLGFAVFGPRVGGFSTSGDMRLDFFGGFPDATDGLSAAHVRLRTMQLALEGTRTSVRAGQDAPFFSPQSPSSLSSTAYPAFAGAGNIWAWTPQVYVEHRFEPSDSSTVAVRAGVLDPLTGELPRSEYSRLANAGERSRMPAVAAHVGARRGSAERAASAGAGAYYARHDWGYHRNVTAWAATADWDVPVSSAIRLSGEAYTGVAIGGLGGGAHSSVLFDGDPALDTSAVFPLHSRGGWAQVKLKASQRLEFNVAYGLDRSRPRNAPGLLQAPSDEAPSATRNAGAMANVIHQLRSNLFLTLEYHRLWTTRFDGRSWLADHVSLGGAIVF